MAVDTIDTGDNKQMRQYAKEKAKESQESCFRSAREDITSSRSDYLAKCDPFANKVGRELYVEQGDQLTCYEVKSNLAVGGQATLFRGRREPKRETHDTVKQQFICLKAHELARQKMKPLSELDPFIDEAEKEAETVQEEKGKRGLRKALEELLEQQKEDNAGLRTPNNDVCIRATTTLSDAQAKRMNREIALMGMRHPNIVTIYNFGVIGGRGVFVTELVKRVASPYGFSLDQLIRGAIGAAKGLKYYHDRGVFHRDVKPENVLFKKPNGTKVTAKVIDPGLAVITDFETPEERLTFSNEFLGTPIYASPEQSFSSKNADAQSDIYCLGATLYELLTWESPNPFNPDSSDVQKIMECLNNLHNKYYGLEHIKPVRVMNIDRRITMKELFGLYVRGREEKTNGNGKYTEIDMDDDILEGRVKLCNPVKQTLKKIWNHRIHHRTKNKLQNLEIFLACMMHPGERDESGLQYKRDFRYSNMRQVIKDLKSVLEGDKPENAYRIIERKYGNITTKTKDLFIHEVFADHNRYSKKTMTQRLGGAANYTAKAAAAVAAGLAAGGVGGYLLNKYLQLGDRLANFVGDIASNLPN
ncbi:protein kinase [Candidatus Woesearchaeota archaeon]|nr:protein kinase [Candidatus Woesearchaeota archaeon]